MPVSAAAVPPPTALPAAQPAAPWACRTATLQRVAAAVLNFVPAGSAKTIVVTRSAGGVIVRDVLIVAPVDFFGVLAESLSVSVCSLRTAAVAGIAASSASDTAAAIERWRRIGAAWQRAARAVLPSGAARRSR